MNLIIAPATQIAMISLRNQALGMTTKSKPANSNDMNNETAKMAGTLSRKTEAIS